MNTLLVFVVRLILGLVFGIIIVRIFKPEWPLYQGAALGAILVALSYGLRLLSKNKKA